MIGQNGRVAFGTRSCFSAGGNAEATKPALCAEGGRGKGGRSMKRFDLRRSTACLCLCALLCGGMTVPAQAAGFTDVSADHWAAEAISRCVTQGWFQGQSADTFGVGQPMTRGAFAVVLSRFFGWESTDDCYQIFSDVSENAWYEPALRACYEHGAVTRQTADFRPADAITREELAVMLVRALGYSSVAGLLSEDDLPFTDVTTNRGYITLAYEMGLVNGMSSSLFMPERAATREQAAVMLSRLYDKLHPAGQETIAIVRAGEALPDFTGCTTVVLMAGTLSGGQQARFAASGHAEEREQAAEAARAAGCKVLLGVSGQATALKAGASGAVPLIQALNGSGYDGIYLDITLREWSDNGRLAVLAQSLRNALSGKLLYVEADAPVRGKTAPDYTALGKAADRIVLRVSACVDTDAGVSAMEPLESICYGLDVLNDQVSASKLSLLLTTTAQARKNGKKFSSIDTAALAELTEQGSVYYSDRYACAYAETEDTVAWFLNDRALEARRQLLNCYGVDSLCLSALNGTLSPANG